MTSAISTMSHFWGRTGPPQLAKDQGSIVEWFPPTTTKPNGQAGRSIWRYMYTLLESSRSSSSILMHDTYAWYLVCMMHDNTLRPTAIQKLLETIGSPLYPWVLVETARSRLGHKPELLARVIIWVCKKSMPACHGVCCMRATQPVGEIGSIHGWSPATQSVLRG